MKTFRRSVVVLCLLVACMALAAAETIVARVGSVKASQPYSWRENGQWVGMDIDFYKALEKESGVTFVFEPLPWSRALDYLKIGKCNLMTQLSRTPEREAYMHFLGPYQMEDIVLVVKEANREIPISNLTELEEAARKSALKVGIEDDAFYSEEFNARLKSDPGFADQFEMGKTTLNLMVLHDRLFGSFDRRAIASYQIKNLPEARGLAIHPFQISTGPVYFGVSKETPDAIVRKLQDACARLMTNGTFRKIDAKWNIR